MTGYLIQGSAFLLFVCAVLISHRTFIRPYRSLLDSENSSLLLLLTLTFWGGLLGSPLWWMNFPWSFSWALPPLAGRMLASAGVAFAALSLMVLRRPTPRRLHLILICLTAYLVPLVCTILMFHLQRFNFSVPITYGFFAIAGGMAVATLWFYFGFGGMKPILPDEDPGTHSVVETWLWAVGLMTGLWGAALFAIDNGPLKQIWIWPGDPLTTRLIGSMLITIAWGALFSRKHADVARMMLVFMMIYGLGAGLANLWNVLAGKPIKLFYFVFFLDVGLISTLLLPGMIPHKKPLDS